METGWPRRLGFVICESNQAGFNRPCCPRAPVDSRNARTFHNPIQRMSGPAAGQSNPRHAKTGLLRVPQAPRAKPGPRPSPRPAVPAFRGGPRRGSGKTRHPSALGSPAPHRDPTRSIPSRQNDFTLVVQRRTPRANASSKPPQCRRCRYATARAGSRVYALIMPVSFTGMTRLGRTPLHAARQSIPVHAQNPSAGYAHEPGAQTRRTQPAPAAGRSTRQARARSRSSARKLPRRPRPPHPPPPPRQPTQPMR